MSVLTKDFQTIVVEKEYEVTFPQGEATTTLGKVTVNAPGGIEGSIPVITSYPLNPNVVPTTRGVRLCTISEVAALKAYLFAGLNEPEASTELYQLLYQEWGKPLQLFASDEYIAAWYKDIGVGFHYFVGYDPTDYPTQIITASALQKVF